MNPHPLRKVEPLLEEARRGNLPFFAHLEELRRRLIYCLWAIALAFGVSYTFAKPLFHFLMNPVLKLLGTHGVEQTGQLYFTTLSEPFMTDLKVAFFASIIFASPIIFYHLWKFVSPGLYRDERRGFLALTALSFFFFLGGVSFAYYVMFPMSFGFFLSFTTPDVKPILTISTYLSFAINLLLAFGLIFELPLVILILSLSGIVQPKQVLKFWRYAIVIISIFSAVLTPGPDVASMMLMMLPMVALYFLGILFAFIFARKPKNAV